MGFVEDKVYDFVMEYVDAGNRAEAMRLLDDAFDKREDGDLTLDDAKKVIDKLLDLARPEERPELEKMLAKNQGLLEKYLKS